MAGPIFYNGSLLFVGGQLAMSTNCCCDGAGCCGGAANDVIDKLYLYHDCASPMSSPVVKTLTAFGDSLQTIEFFQCSGDDAWEVTFELRCVGMNPCDWELTVSGVYVSADPNCAGATFSEVLEPTAVDCEGPEIWFPTFQIPDCTSSGIAGTCCSITPVVGPLGGSAPGSSPSSSATSC